MGLEGAPVARIAEELEKLFGPEKVVSDPHIVRLYSREPSGLEGRAEAVVFPESALDVSRLVRYAYSREVYIYPQGSSTDLAGGAFPERPGVVVSMERMRRVREVSVLDSVAVVEPGVRLWDLNVELSRYRYMFPIDPGSVKVATVGGAINTGAGGMRGARYGTMRDWVLGLEIVLPDEEGTILRVGCRTLKCRQGYDLARLIVGSEGTLAIVTEAILKITPMPENVVVVLAFFPTLRQLVDAVIEVKSRAIDTLLMEFMDVDSARLAAETLGASIRPDGHMLLVGVPVYREASTRVLEEMVSIAKAAGAASVYTAKSMEEAEEKKLLEIRRSLFATQALLTQKQFKGRKVMMLMEDIAVPPSKLLDAVERLKELEAKYGFKTVLGGHIGDGNLHPTISYPVDDEKAKEAALNWYYDVMKMAIELGGTVSAEHGIGVLKKEALRLELERMGSVKALEIMAGIKRVFDPKGILNPGKVVAVE
ncbi:D-lactate dehydrogenase [Aeropyrum pernix]|uniref:D-lactate dehydrogenase n=1 Tax=Aeropyrum pernix TaxID=56636 RepID=A0A401H8L5_AERPX|nr:D-lactate dehydrogenase [Aeropyrum pernix]